MSVLDLALSYRDDPKLREDVFIYDDGVIRGMISIDRNFSPGARNRSVSAALSKNTDVEII